MTSGGDGCVGRVTRRSWCGKVHTERSAMSDITKKLLNDLDTFGGASPVGAAPDLTTWLARKMAVEVQPGATSEVPLYDGDDVLDELRTYLNTVAD